MALSFTDRRTLKATFERGGVFPMGDMPGGRKVYDSQLRYLKKLEARGLLATDPDGPDDSFILTRAGAEAIGVEVEE